MSEQKPQKTMFLTGATGHIGSRLLGDISPAVTKVVALGKSGESIEKIPRAPHTELNVVEGDLEMCEFDALLDGVDVVVHLAGLTKPGESANEKERYEAINVGAVEALARACVQKSTPLFFPSTASVYAGEEDVLLSENTDALQPQSVYAQTKLQAEDILRGHMSSSPSFSIARFGSVFGYAPGIKFHTAVNKFVWQACRGEPLSVWKTAFTQMRPYTYVGDCVSAINFFIEQDLFSGEVYNVVSENATVEHILTILRHHFPSLVVEAVDAPLMNTLSYGLDNSKIRSLGFTPRGTLKGGIEETVAALTAQGDI